MTVYVDNMQMPKRIGRTAGHWSHLLADSPTELRAFAAELGLAASWIQHAGTYREHFDVTESVRRRALAMGAESLDYPRGAGQHISAKRSTYGGDVR